jgi:hypothetical protein
MNTFHHGIWVYIFSNSNKKWYLYVIGGILPDIVYFIKGIQLMLNGIYPDLNNRGFFYSLILSNIWVNIASNFLHSLFIWLILIVIIFFTKTLRPITPLMWGWLSHIIIDLLTHHTDAMPLFWPISSLVFQSPVSYWERKYFGLEFSIITSVVMIVLFASVLYKKLKKRNKTYNP